MIDLTLAIDEIIGLIILSNRGLYPVIWFEKQVEYIDFDGAPHRQKGLCGILVFRQALRMHQTEL